MVNANFVGRIYRVYGPRGGIKMNDRNLSRRRLLKFLAVFFTGLFAIRWQEIIRIFSQKNTRPNLKEAKHYSRSDDMAG